MSTLRARQKEDRRNRIVSSAKTLFKDKGYDKTTIENIAVAAEVSGVTVHNYYGTKAGVLLALVIESDKQLIAQLDESMPHEQGDLITLMIAFARRIMAHAIKTLEKDIWRQVIAAVTTEAGTPLSKAYSKLDEQLSFVLVRRIEAMQAAGTLPGAVNPLHLGRALFQLQNARFIEFISSDQVTQDEIETRLRNDLVALFSVCIDQAHSA
ncbi:transcriptional regulator BetI [Thalassovita gelatinovora]|uniref:Transcriptional regulator BetI n=1 Tax=Thalassovita gelatinovora TaxID=53501 RepID=A0A0P1FCD1_THAGE|nr:TetR/AcrR family transcriptional regulator [Thalassovita gelatinovora]QIZ80081.1 TetR/AcrR family transcriptional regulator [Thalassovita gelatinovora]CUH65503.1 transcriptional regulator BetI [Thalassovita gelatinovora]SER08621.1 transcriptional regulator, TetR family [Thalassovita gelatinovora]